MSIFKKENDVFNKVENRILSLLKTHTELIIKYEKKIAVKMGVGIWLVMSIGASFNLLKTDVNLIEYLKFMLAFGGLGIFTCLLIIGTDIRTIKKQLTQMSNYGDKSYFDIINLCKKHKKFKLSNKDLLINEDELKELLTVNLNADQKLKLNQIIKEKGSIEIDDVMLLKHLSLNTNNELKQQEINKEKNNLSSFIENYNLNQEEKSFFNQEIELELNEKKFKNLL